MTGRRRAVTLLALWTVLTGVLVAVFAGPAVAHEERPASFPDGTGERPTFLGLDNPRHRVVCRPESAHLIAAMAPGALKQRNQALLDECAFSSIQSAINSIKERKTSIYVLPGVYTERKWAEQKRSSYCSHLKTESDDPLSNVDFIGSMPDPNQDDKPSDPIALSYSDQRRCAHNLNLIAIFGDSTPHNDSIKCDSQFCGTQIVGTGPRRDSAIVDNRFSKLNAFRGDRVGGLYLSNLTFQQAEFNAVYVMETDGFVLDRLIARGDDEYGILAFASDHGLIQKSETYYNGDSGIYPGSASDVNGDNTNFAPTRYSVVIRDNRSHDNTLGYSGTAGNSVHSYDNRFYDNATGIATDSLFPGHPGLPQDHARWDHNLIYSNNSNYYTKYVQTGVCQKPMAERGYMSGTVCPVVPVPVGTGLLIAGGNFNSVDHNHIYDNWRYGTMLFWVPAPLRDEYDPTKLYDTSHDNHTVANFMGIAPDGSTAYNGMDHWWDDEGGGNCWDGNASSHGTATNNFTVQPASCADGGSQFTPGASVKDAGFLSCSQYDRNDDVMSDPPNCNWFVSPPKPTKTSGDPFPGPVTPAALAGKAAGPSDGLALLGVVPLLGLGAALRLRRRGRVRHA